MPRQNTTVNIVTDETTVYYHGEIVHAQLYGTTLSTNEIYGVMMGVDFGFPTEKIKKSKKNKIEMEW